MSFPVEKREDISAALIALTLASPHEPGCVSYIAHWVEGEPATCLIYEQYHDEAAVDAHRATPHFAQYATGVLYQHMLDRTVEHLHTVV